MITKAVRQTNAEKQREYRKRRDKSGKMEYRRTVPVEYEAKLDELIDRLNKGRSQ